MQYLKNITEETHYPGTKAHKKVQNYLVEELKKLGLEVEVQTQTIFGKKWSVGTTTENIIAKIKGSEEGKALLLLSHYDSNPHSAIGASDAGSGVVTILEAVRAFLHKKEQPKNDVIILISDAEEIGLLGLICIVGIMFSIIWRIFRISRRVKNPIYHLFTLGIALMIIIAFLINSYGISGMIPIKGIAVPFLSYGGSSMFSMSIAIGLVLSISRVVSDEEIQIKEEKV